MELMWYMGWSYIVHHNLVQKYFQRFAQLELNDTEILVGDYVDSIDMSYLKPY